MPDLSGDVKKLETDMELLRIENTELHERCALSDKATSDVQEQLNTSIQEQKTLEERVTSV